MSKPRRAVVVIDEALGKRVRRLSLAEPYPKSHEVYLTIEFDDRTEILIEVDASPSFIIRHLARDANQELEPAKQSNRGSVRSIARAQKQL